MIKPMLPSYKWALAEYRPSGVLEDSIWMLDRRLVLQRELDVDYSAMLIAGGKAYLPAHELAVIEEAYAGIKPVFYYVPILTQLESELAAPVDRVSSASMYDRARKLLGRHLGYYTLAKYEATAIYNSPTTSELDRASLERWRNREDHFAAYDKLWDKVGRRLETSTDDLSYWLDGEVTAAWRGELANYPDVAARKTGPFSLVLEDGKVTGVAEDLSPLMAETTKAETVTGQVAYAGGKMRGVVGLDILVTTMTTPQMTAEIRRARAVVTDEGGVLSHAAIMCREFKIPCIVGTLVATQMFGDGDLVEVDTESGVVRLVESS